MLQQEDINFLLTNRIPRRLATRFIGWFSRIEHPIVRDLSIATWQAFAGDLNLAEAKKTAFASMHDCFIRQLKDGARPIDSDPRTLVSPCDGIVVAAGTMREIELIQAKGHTYTLDDLLGGQADVAPYVGGTYVTLRLTASMYHRFHAPSDCEIRHVTHISGDRWNVNPTAIKRVPRLYCRNERAVLHARLGTEGQALALVAVGAILVASIHLNFIDVPGSLTSCGANHIRCRASFRKGQELGYFHQGSTIIVIASSGIQPCAHVQPGERIRMGQPLLRQG
jgi:phosphatidylserine decarboxylase